MAEPLLSNPDPDAPSLVGGEYGAPAFQSVEQPSGERTVGQVPRATMVQPAPLPSDFGVFHDLVPQERPQVGGVDFGLFSDLIPKPPPSITPASDAVVAATGQIYGSSGPTTAEAVGMEKAFKAAHPSLYGVARGVAGMIPTPEQVIQAGEEVNKASEHPIASLATLPGQIVNNATEMGKAARGDYGPEAQAQTITGAVLTAAPLLHLPFAKGVDLAREAPPTGPRPAVEPAEAMRPPPETPTTEAAAEPTIIAEPAPETPAAAAASKAPDYDPEGVGAKEWINRRVQEGVTREQALQEQSQHIQDAMDWGDALPDQTVIKSKDGRIFTKRAGQFIAEDGTVLSGAPRGAEVVTGEAEAAPAAAEQPPTVAESAPPVTPRVRAAIRLKDGQVIEAASHPLAYDQAKSEGASFAGMEEGFTVNGKFLYRDEALHAVAGSTVEDIAAAKRTEASNKFGPADEELLKALAAKPEPAPAAPAGEAKAYETTKTKPDVIPTAPARETVTPPRVAEPPLGGEKPRPGEVVSLPNWREGGFIDKPAVFLRFGEPPKTGPSGRYLEGKRISDEAGVSAVHAWRDPETGKYVIRKTGTEDIEGIESLANRKAYVVEGEPLKEVGGDEEPLLKAGTVKVVGEVPMSQITTDSLHNIALDGTEWAEHETPDWTKPDVKPPAATVPTTGVKPSRGEIGVSGTPPRVAEPPQGGEAAAVKAPVETTSGIYPKANVRTGNPNFDVTPADLGVDHPLPEFINRAINGLTTGTSSGSGFINSIKATVGAAMNKTFPKTTLADRVAGEKMARWVASKDAAPYLSDVHAAQVLENTKVDPNKLGAALTEDNLRSVRATSETPGAVNTIIGARGSPFKTEEMYQKFLADPDVQKAIERHKALWGEVVDPMYRKAMQIDPSETLPSRGEQTGARINLMPIVEGGPQRNVVQSIGKGNLTGTMRRKSPFGRRAKGTGESYNTNYFDMMANTYGRQLEIANKNDFENHLVQSGNAVVGKPGEHPVLADGEATVGFPLKRTAIAVKATEEGGPPRTIPVNRYLYVRKGLANEYRRAANVDAMEVPLILKGITMGANKAALAGLTDASVHTLNLGTGLFTRPSVAGGVISDTLLSLTGRADIPVTLVKAITKAFKDNRAQLAQLAEIGALRAAETKPIRGPMSLMGHTIRWADKTTRLVLDDAYQKMAKAGLVENTETARREFVNQVGQYNLRAQNPLVRVSRESGLAPFATAGTTFNALGVRTALMSPGVKAASPLAAAALRANVLSKWVGGFTLVGALNYMITKKLWGRPGTPIGSVDTGRDDENGNPLTYNVFAILGLSRAMRATGVRGVVEAKKMGLNNLNALDAGFRDAFNTWISPFAGPTPRLIAGLTNQPIGIGLPKPHPIAAPGESQTIENVKGSIIEANPIAASIADLHKVGGSEKKAIQRQLPRLTLTPGRPAEFVANYPLIVERAQTRAFIDDVIGRARRLDPDKREIFIEDSLNRIPEDQRRWALRTIRQARLGGSVSPIVRTSQ